ncbi:glycosyltransferase [Flavobacterium sp. K5-23]|uniref:glycosyltransferase n=1 Tax=Flavobacterium sp. K5-23 TaxID=2746225 RepID=UPI00200EE4B2|nr:glycosyltransferase [Flavobacterium sp. K5-23]UQD55566.1 glycosyltransferase [Flavobacterium sp. K5-23]
MKIIHIINSLESGGAEKLLLETLPYYNNSGIQADLLVLKDVDCPFMTALKAAECCSIYSLGKHSVYNPITIFKIIPFLKKYDIAHVHLFPTQYWVVLAKLFSFSKIKLVLTEHNTTNPRKENYFLRNIDRFFYRFYDKVVCVSEEILNTFQKYTRLEKTKFIKIENGINLNEIYKATPYLKSEISSLWKDQDILLIQVSRFSKQKDQKTVINALKFLPKEVKLLLVGDGVLRKSCENLVQKLDLNGRVIFMGLRMDIPQLLKTADISILSSNWEGFGLVAVESMAAGKPFVASNVPGMSDIVKGGGILFEKGNIKELVFFIEKLINNQSYYNEIANACKTKSKQYDIQFMEEKHLELYKKLLNK